MVDMTNMAGAHASPTTVAAMSPAPPLPTHTGGSPRALGMPLRPDGGELGAVSPSTLQLASASVQLASASRAVHTAASPPGEGSSDMSMLLKRAEQRADSAENALAVLSNRSRTLEATIEERDAEVRQLKSNAPQARTGGAPSAAAAPGPAGVGRSNSPSRARASSGRPSESVVAHSSYSEERAAAIKDAKRMDGLAKEGVARADAAETALADISVQLEAEKAARAEERAAAAADCERLLIALDTNGKETSKLESALVGAAVVKQLEWSRSDTHVQLTKAVSACTVAEKQAEALRAQVRTAEAAAAAARANAAKEQAAAAASALELAVAQKDQDEKLDRALAERVAEQAASSRAALVQEKSKAQAESKKAIARVEREAEAKMGAQRDEFAKHERSLRERIVQLQNSVAETREKAGRAKAGGSDAADLSIAIGNVRDDSPSRVNSSRSSASNAESAPSASNKRGAGRRPLTPDEQSAVAAATAAAEVAQKAAAASAEVLRVEREQAAAASAATSSLNEATIAVMVRELLQVEADGAEDAAAAERMRERLSTETRHLQRKLSRVTKESEQKMAEERSALEQRLADTARRSETKLRAERARLAVRYGNSSSERGKPSSERLAEPGKAASQSQRSMGAPSTDRDRV